MSSELISIEPMPENQEVIGKLNALADGVRDTALKRAVKAGAKPIADIMRATAPDNPKTPGSSLSMVVNTLALRDGQKVKIGKGREAKAVVGDATAAVVVGPNRARMTLAGFRFDSRPLQLVALWLEHGTKPHQIGKRKVRLNIGGRFITGPIMHPGARPTRWMQRAMDGGGPQIQAEFYRSLSNFIEKLAQ